MNYRNRSRIGSKSAGFGVGIERIVNKLDIILREEEELKINSVFEFGKMQSSYVFVHVYQRKDVGGIDKLSFE